MSDETPTDEPQPPMPASDAAQRPSHEGVETEPAPTHPPAAALPEAYAASTRHERERFLSGEDLAPPGRRIKLPAILFIATCITTFWAGCKDWEAAFVFLDFDAVQDTIAQVWRGI